MQRKHLRVIQWATGNIGTRSLQMILSHPQMSLVGLYVSNKEKAGRDAGALADRDPVGIIATDSIDEILKLDADCVIYMRHGCDYDEVCRILESGKNIVATRSEFHHPASIPSDVRARLEAACSAGNSSLYSTGSSPGFITEALPLPLLSLQRRLDCLSIDEFGDLSQRNSADLVLNQMCFGKPAADFKKGRIQHLKESFGASIRQLTDAINLSVDSIEAFGEIGLTQDRETISCGVVEAGTIGGQRITVQGLRGSKVVMQFRATWYVTPRLTEAWEIQESGWRVRVDGDTPLDVSIQYPVERKDFPTFSPGLTAHRAVNAVEAVCAALPGIRTTADLPNVVADLGVKA